MTGPVFVDTNVLVYARDAGEPIKQARAMDLLRLLWESRLGRVSLQVLQEYYVTVTRKLRLGLPKTDARLDVESLMTWRPLVPSRSTLTKAWKLEDRFQLSCWDSLIVAAALESRCEWLLSEDMQDGLKIENLRIQNPFAGKFDVSA